MLYFEIIFCNDDVGLVSVAWESIAPAARVGGGVCTRVVVSSHHFRTLYFFRQLFTVSQR